jgi:hypothetical protein
MISKPFMTAGQLKSRASASSLTACPIAFIPSRLQVGVIEAWQWRHAPACGRCATRSVCSWS